MPVKCVLQIGKYRLVKSDSGEIETSVGGKPVDGGGHDDQVACEAQARAINSSVGAAFALSCESSELEPWELLDAARRRYRKHVIYEGRFRKGNEWELEVDRPLIELMAGESRRMLANGIKIPTPIKHTTDTEANRGNVVGWETGYDAKGRWSLFSLHEFRDEEAEKLAKTSDVSLFSPPEFTDGAGHTYTRPIRHVALTDYPVIPDLEGWQVVAASHVASDIEADDPPTKEKKDMAPTMRSLATKLGLKPADDASDEHIETAISEAFRDLGSQTRALKKKAKELEANKKPPESGAGANGEGEGKPKKEPPVEKPKIAASTIGIVRENRTMKIDALVGKKITQAQADELKAIYCADDAIELACSSDVAMTENDPFTAQLRVLGKGQDLKLLGEKTPPQVLSLSADENPMVADAKARADQARAAVGAR